MFITGALETAPGHEKIHLGSRRASSIGHFESTLERCVQGHDERPVE